MAVQLDVSQPRLLGPGEGETVTDRPERTVRILCDHELVDVAWSRYEHGERGPDPHIHKHHADGFYVLSGELTFDLGPAPTRIKAPAGSLVLIPQDVIHSFRNESGGQTTYLNIHAPSCGFAGSLRGNPEGFDTHDPPEDGGRPASDAVVYGPGEGEEEIVAGDGASRLLIKAGGKTGEGTVLVAESSVAPGFLGPPLHRHEHHVDSFFVLEGPLTLLLGDGEVEAGSGSYVVVPPGNVHTFSNRGGSRLRVLNLMAPGGFEEFIKATARGERLEGYDFQIVTPPAG
jgi:mannose-6-phosphate isomerase-like protein (cupin superfamily)